MLFSSLDDFSYLLTMLKSTSILIAATFFLIVFGSANLSKNLLNVFFVSSLICIFFGTIPEFKFILYPFKYGDDIGNSLIGSSEYRDAFLAGSSYFGISSLYGLSFAYFIYFCLKEKSTHNYLKLLVIAIAGILAGRVALVCYLISIIYFFIIKRNIKILLFSILSMFIFIFILNYFTAFEEAKIWFDEMFSAEGGGESESVSQFKSVLALPESEYTLIFGDAKYGNSESYYGGSDSGFLRNIFFGGFVYLFFLVFSFFLIFFKNIRNTFIYLLIVICFVLHFKGVFIFNNPGFFGVLLTICFVLYKEKLGLIK